MADEPGQRSSSGSGRSSQSKKQTPQQQLSTIERSVTHLLVATKQLLETLTQWSRGNATENEVSDVYVRLGYEFNIACRAFNAIGVDTSDLGPVPDLLRGILEETLSQEASQSSLDRFLPRIRDIIINLLHGLKKKQQRIRQRPPREGEAPSRSNTGDSVVRSSSGKSGSRQGSLDNSVPELPPRISSANNGRSSPSSRYDDASKNNNVNDAHSDGSDGSSLSSNTMQNIPVIAPYPAEEMMPEPPAHGTPYSSRSADLPAPPPPPKQQDALLALQRGGDLERRASRRFSTYQIKQQLGASANGMPVIPLAQNSPIPNRGREVRESMNAVRTRGSLLHARKDSSNRFPTEASPNRLQTLQQPRILEEKIESAGPVQPPPVQTTYDMPPRKTEDGAPPPRYTGESGSKDEPMVGATLSGPITDPGMTIISPNGELTPIERQLATIPARSGSRRAAKTPTPPPQTQQFVPEDSPQPGKPLTLFLQYKSRIKKIVLEEGSSDLTIARLQLAFIEKFSWNTHNNGVDLPEIYIQDQVSGVRHELEDINDIKDRSVLVLNVEALDEVKRHIDDGLGGLRKVVEGIKTSIDNQQSAFDRISDRQQETARELASLATAGPAPASSARASNLPPLQTSGSLRSSGTPRGDTQSSLEEIQRLRRDLAIMRQTYANFVKDVDASMAAVRTKAASVKTTAIKVSLPDLSGDTGRVYVTQGKKSLSDDSENIVKRVDGVLDSIEDLRKDVVSRGVRPLPRQLEDVAKDISSVTAELKKMKDFVRKEKPLWTKIWEQELANVCEERDMLTMNEELVVDLEGDLETAVQTLRLVEEATKQQMADNAGNKNSGSGSRNASGKILGLQMDQAVDPRKAKDSILNEVRALQPNHETSQNRLEAIERAEKARLRELESRKEGEFKRELGSFVEEGKLKKTGGAEEAERLRKSKDERIRREVWERMNGIAPSEPEGEAA
ncbi:AIP3-domain-containing protein, partial [Rhizodiscina lignyota]